MNMIPYLRSDIYLDYGLCFTFTIGTLMVFYSAKLSELLPFF